MDPKRLTIGGTTSARHATTGKARSARDAAAVPSVVTVPTRTAIAMCASTAGRVIEIDTTTGMWFCRRAIREYDTMNKMRRAEIDKAIGLLQSISSVVDEAKSIIDSAASEERDYYDNMPENMQSSERGEQADTAATALEEVTSALEEIAVDDLIQQLEEAKG